MVARAQASGDLRADVAISDVPMVQLMHFGRFEATSELSPEL